MQKKDDIAIGKEWSSLPVTLHDGILKVIFLYENQLMYRQYQINLNLNI